MKRINRITWSISLALLLCGNIIASDICITEILISGNKVTKDFTILRELPFHTGDVFPENELIRQLQMATDNLNNISLFNYVNVDYFPDPSAIVRESSEIASDPAGKTGCTSCIVTIQVEERWYFWPQVSLKLEDRNLSSWLHEKDFSRITIGWGLRIENVFGLRHTLSTSHYFGYQKGFRLSYSNIALDKNRTQLLGFSVVSLYNKTMNVTSENDKVVYVKDPNHFLDKTFSGAINYSYRPGIRNTHTLSLGFKRTQLRDTVLQINKHYWGSDNLVNNSFTTVYTYSHEHRNYIAYPTRGYYAGTEVKGVMADKMNFFYGSLNLKLQYYKELSSRWLWSSRLNTGATFKNKRAYIYDQNVGYEEKNIAGYDYYVIDGQQYALLNNDLRFCIMPQRIFKMSSSDKLSKFTKIHFALYAKLMYDMGYVNNRYNLGSNTLANTLLWGSGLGLDLVTYYDIVLNCNYSINKMGEGAFYFGIKAPIF